MFSRLRGLTSIVVVMWLVSMLSPVVEAASLPALIDPAPTFVAPTVTNVTPNCGATAGGDTVTITGTGFQQANPADVLSVTFGSTGASTFTVDSDTQITVTSPAVVPGTVDITVGLRNGSVSATGAADQFTYSLAGCGGGGGGGGAPTVGSITPAVGVTTGNTDVLIGGTGFTGATAVSICGIAATNVSVVNATTITAKTGVSPAAQAACSVLVTTPGGTNGANTLFSYVVKPTISAVSSSTITAGVQTTITLTGTGFTAGTTVTYGASGTGTSPATTFIDSTHVSVPVTLANGVVAKFIATTSTIASNLSSVTVTGAVSTPTISSVSGPNSTTSIPAATATTITIAGGNFASGATVSYLSGGVTTTVPSGSVTLTGSTQATFSLTLAAAATATNFQVTANSLTSTANTTIITGVAAPNPRSVIPAVGEMGGGSVQISGTGFTGATQVLFGGTTFSASEFTVNGAGTTISLTAPAVTDAGVDQSVSVTVTTAFGAGTGTNIFTYKAKPVIGTISVGGITPATGPTNGGTLVSITGSNFVVGGTTVTFGGVTASLNTSSPFVVNAPAAASAGAVDVQVSTVWGNATATRAYTYTTPVVAPPSVTSISPSSGPTTGNTPVSIFGSNLGGVTSVTFGGVAATISASGTPMTVLAPPATRSGNVTVQVVSGSSVVSANQTYVYLPTMITAVASPNGGSPLVTLTGTGFDGVDSVTYSPQGRTINFNSASDSTSFVVSKTATQVVLKNLTGLAAGSTRFVMTASGVQSSPSPLLSGTLTEPPTITGINPTSGPVGGGNTVEISGTNFASSPTVTFGSRAAQVSFSTNETIRVVVPEGAAAANVTVQVVSGGTPLTATQPYQYTGNSTSPVPTITGISPTTGDIFGQYYVVISGTNFSTPAVTFGGEKALLLSSDDSTLTVRVPSVSTARNVSVQVVSGGTPVLAPQQFQYTAKPQLAAAEARPVGNSTSVILIGKNFLGTPSVNRIMDGSTISTVVTPESETRIVLENLTGLTVNVTKFSVTSNGFESRQVPLSGSVYAPPIVLSKVPLIRSISTSSGPAAGGTAVVVSGDNFDNAIVRFNGETRPATSGFAVQGHTLTFSSPAGTPGSTVYIQVLGPNGSDSRAFTYQANATAPTITTISPNPLPSNATSFTITGTGFSVSRNTVRYRANSSASPVILALNQPSSGGRIVMDASMPYGTLQIDVINEESNLVSGTEPITRQEPPLSLSESVVTMRLDGVSIANSTDSRLILELLGDLCDATSASILDENNVQVMQTNVLGKANCRVRTTATFDAPVGIRRRLFNPSTLTVTLSSATGTTPPSPSAMILLAPVPSIISVSPSIGSISGGTEVTITGLDVVGASSVKFGSVQASSFRVLSSSTIVATAPAQAAGTVDITITNAGVTSPVVTVAKFTYSATVPTMGEWFMGLLTLLLIGIGYESLRRRRAAEL